ncbi:MAG: hypothetical protein HWN79_08375 [Candidatus Lokiarchaeota archaeon]|nr:hypothetical protein [Candidatus Lokiarchaeota archaeon]
MNIDDHKYIYIRSLIFLGIFIILHYTYDWFPNIVFQIISGIDESVFQHMKIGFYSYIILMIIELLVFKKKIADNTKFIFSRFFSAIFYPWIMFMFFFLTRVVYPEQMHFVAEIISAQITVYITAIFIGFIEFEIIKIEFGKRLKVLLLILIVILIVEFTAFTFYLPWHDVLTDPYK